MAGKLPKKTKPKRSHFQSEADFGRAIWTRSCEMKNINPWIKFVDERTKPRSKDKRKIRRENARYYSALASYVTPGDYSYA